MGALILVSTRRRQCLFNWLRTFRSLTYVPNFSNVRPIHEVYQQWFCESITLLVISVAIGCSHVQKTTEGSATYQHEVNKAFEEAAERSANVERRKPASGAEIAQLARLAPGKFKVYVFPKRRNLADKFMGDDAPIYRNADEERFSLLGQPQEYEVSTIAMSPCHQFISGNQFSKLGAKDYFEAELAENKSRQCAIVEVTSLKIKNADRALIRRDDLLRTRLFIDDAYVLHGYDLERHVNGQNTKVTRVKAAANEASSSGITQFPVDIPTVAILGGSLSTRGQIDTSKKVDRLAVNQVRKHFMRGFSAPSCSGVISKYTDFFGSKVEVGWCDGSPFPQYMENSRFVAVTQTLSVR